MSAGPAEPISLFLCGDVMTGRGIDQILPHPGDPTLYEPHIRNARDYVLLAEQANGPIARPAAYDYIWGDMLAELQRVRTDARIINLETTITRSNDYWPGKEVHYRMNPGNIDCLTAAGIDCCCLANNHVLDWGYAGLEETLRSLNDRQMAHAGAGTNATQAAAPAILRIPGKGRVLIFSLGSTTSGIPRQWRATDAKPGVNLLPGLTEDIAVALATQIAALKQPGDVAIASIHWGGNWGYEIPDQQVAFARRLVEHGVDLVHGHSSHHVKVMEVYRDHLILYGCGDFLNDYEGIAGYEAFRSDLTLMYLVWLDPRDGRLVGAQFAPLQTRQFRLHRASSSDSQWLAHLLNHHGARFGTQVRLGSDGYITL